MLGTVQAPIAESPKNTEPSMLRAAIAQDRVRGRGGQRDGWRGEHRADGVGPPDLLPGGRPRAGREERARNVVTLNSSVPTSWTAEAVQSVVRGRRRRDHGLGLELPARAARPGT